MTENGEWGIVVQVGGGGPGRPNQPGRNVGGGGSQPQPQQRLQSQQNQQGPRPGQVGGDPRTGPNGRPLPGQVGQVDSVCVGAGGQDGENGSGAGFSAGSSSGSRAGSRGPASGSGNRNGGQQVTGPILGVCSLAEGEALKVLFGEQRYSDWHFTVQKLTATHSPVGGDPRDVYPQRAEWLGRPFRPGIQPETGAPPAGSLPAGNLPNDKNP